MVGKPIGQIMASWTEQMGYPLLRITGVEFHSEVAVLDIEQSWFLMDGSSVGATHDNDLKHYLSSG